MKRNVEFRRKCACGWISAWRIERKRVPERCPAYKRSNMHVAVVEKRTSEVETTRAERGEG